LCKFKKGRKKVYSPLLLGLPKNLTQKGEYTMIELNVNVPEVKEFINDIAKAPSKIFDMLRLNVRGTVGKYLTALMEAELTVYLGENVTRGMMIIRVIEMVDMKGDLHLKVSEKLKLMFHETGKAILRQKFYQNANSMKIQYAKI